MNGLDILYTACVDNKMICLNCPMFNYAKAHNITIPFDCKELYDLMVYGRITEE